MADPFELPDSYICDTEKLNESSSLMGSIDLEKERRDVRNLVKRYEKKDSDELKMKTSET
jgi:hypothetical protein